MNEKLNKQKTLSGKRYKGDSNDPSKSISKKSNLRQSKWNPLATSKGVNFKSQSKTIERKITLSSSISSIKPESVANRIINKSNSSSVIKKPSLNKSWKFQKINK